MRTNNLGRIRIQVSFDGRNQLRVFSSQRSDQIFFSYSDLDPGINIRPDPQL